jgi:alkanesulfonate monooxygenase SsuD/methylene tetrahydromethanopterin reductase-like flavin-dependent oxidoreductase (luciferase family)
VKVGIGLPSALAPPDGRVVVDWARAAEDAGFASVAVIDRLVAPTYDPLTVLAAAAAVTTQVELYTSVLLAPLRPVAVVASQAATVDRLSGGRLRLGVAVGSRRPDYDAAGVPFGRRGRVLDEQLAELRRVWSEPEGFTAAGPAPHATGGPPILLGGTSAAALRRVVEHGAGWICGLGGARAFAGTAEAVRTAWRRAGRPGTPKLLSVVNFVLGPGAPEIRERFLRRYYGAAPFVEGMLRDTPTTLDGVRAVLDAHRAAGCDEVLLFPCASDRTQLDTAAKALS